MGMRFQEITHPDDLNADENLYRKLLDGEMDHYMVEKRYLRKEGHIVWVNLTVSMVRDEQKNPSYVIAVAEDIMDRKKAQDELQLLTKELEQRVCERTMQLEAVNAELKTNEARFRLLVENVKDYAIFMLDPNGFILTWNKGAERINGYQAEEIIGQSFSKFYTEEAVQANYPAYELKIAREQGRFEDESWRVRKDGSLFSPM